MMVVNVKALLPSPDKIVTMALTSTAKHAKTVIASDISSRLNMGQQAVSTRIKIDRIDAHNVSVNMQKASLGLANFMVSRTKQSPVVSILRGTTKRLNKAFSPKTTVILLRTGGAKDDSVELRGSRKARKLGNNLFLLYGASASQVMGQTLETTNRIQDEVGVYFNSEFMRLLNVR